MRNHPAPNSRARAAGTELQNDAEMPSLHAVKNLKLRIGCRTLLLLLLNLAWQWLS
jgi:hypothetical protein